VFIARPSNVTATLPVGWASRSVESGIIWGVGGGGIHQSFLLGLPCRISMSSSSLHGRGGLSCPFPGGPQQPRHLWSTAMDYKWPTVQCGRVNRHHLDLDQNHKYAHWTIGILHFIAEMHCVCLVLFDMNKMIFGTYLAAMNRILISLVCCMSTTV
jgi:hypothetical protein